MKNSIVLLIMSCFAFSSCKFFEECDYYGSLNIELDYSTIWRDEPKPDSLSVALFASNQNILQHAGLKNDTVYQPIRSGKLNVLVWNNDPGLKVSGQKNLETLEFAYQTEMDDKIRRIVSAPMIALHDSELEIPMEGFVDDLASIHPVVKKIVFTHRLFANGVPFTEDVEVKGVLCGLSYRYSYKHGVLPGLAEMQFTPVRTPEHEAHVYTTSFFMIGANTRSDNMHYFTVKIGEAELEFEIALNDSLTEFKKDVLYATFDVDLKHVENDIKIAKWEQCEWESIILQ